MDTRSLPDGMRRTEHIGIRLRPGERDDLHRLASAWGVGDAAAAWAILSDRLAEWRREGPRLGFEGQDPGPLILAASQSILRRHKLAQKG